MEHLCPMCKIVVTPVEHFIQSDKVRYGPDLYVPQKVLVKAFRDFCIEKGIGHYRFEYEMYKSVFKERNVSMSNKSCTYNGTDFPEQPVFYGIDV